MNAQSMANSQGFTGNVDVAHLCLITRQGVVMFRGSAWWELGNLTAWDEPVQTARGQKNFFFFFFCIILDVEEDMVISDSKKSFDVCLGIP